MPVRNLLHVNPDKLFEEHTISEIEEINRKIQLEIERKKEELRTMVGERYRDLIEAADTISDMKVTAENVISHIENMSKNCLQLQQRQLLGFKSGSNNEKSERFSQNVVYHSIAIQIKILMTVPELIWSAVEKEDFLLGTELFLLARHINTGLQFHVGCKDDVPAGQVTTWFPVICRQWSAISHFRWAIPTGCEKKLQCHDLSTEEASNFLCSLVLLEGLNSLQLLDKFLALRSQAVQETLQSEQHISVKMRVGTSLKLLVHTITLLHACFLDGYPDAATPEGRVFKQLKGIVGREAPPAVALIDTINTKHLPAVIQDFRPSTRESMEHIAPSAMRESVSRWLDWVRDLTQSKVNSLLQLVGTVRGLQAVRAEASQVRLPDSWDTMCQQLLIPRGLDLWSNYFQTLLTNRAKELVSQHWLAALQKLKTTLSATASDVTKEKCTQPENDLRWFIWKERSSDLPQGEMKPQQMRGLLMKARGYSPCVEKLCSELDSQLEVILHDLKYYTGEGEPASKFTDRTELQEHVQSASHSKVQELIDFTQTLCKAETERGEARTVLMARFLQALCDLCPNLQMCLMQTQKNQLVIREGTPWQNVCNLLHQESLSIWEMWRESMSGTFSALITSTLGQSLAYADLLHSIPQWDVTSIVEEGEEGRSIRSDIKVPSQPCLPLQSLLNLVCQRLNAVAPHTLPRKIHQRLVEQLVSDVFVSYSSLSRNEALGQAQALQYLLDVKYLAMLLVPRENKVLMSRSQELCDLFEDKVDPFDLDVFCPYLHNNIKKSVQRTQGLVGVLIAWPEKLTVVTGVRTTPGSTSVEDPSVLPVCAGAPWFPLLPVTSMPGTRIIQHHVDKPQRKKTASPKPKGDPTPGEIVRSGAAAFFGAMSSDWFGSG